MTQEWGTYISWSFSNIHGAFLDQIFVSIKESIESVGSPQDLQAKSTNILKERGLRDQDISLIIQKLNSLIQRPIRMSSAEEKILFSQLVPIINSAHIKHEAKTKWARELIKNRVPWDDIDRRLRHIHPAGSFPFIVIDHIDSSYNQSIDKLHFLYELESKLTHKASLPELSKTLEEAILTEDHKHLLYDSLRLVYRLPFYISFTHIESALVKQRHRVLLKKLELKRIHQSLKSTQLEIQEKCLEYIAKRSKDIFNDSSIQRGSLPFNSRKRLFSFSYGNPNLFDAQGFYHDSLLQKLVIEIQDLSQNEDSTGIERLLIHFQNWLGNSFNDSELDGERHATIFYANLSQLELSSHIPQHLKTKLIIQCLDNLKNYETYLRENPAGNNQYPSKETFLYALKYEEDFQAYPYYSPYTIELYNLVNNFRNSLRSNEKENIFLSQKKAEELRYLISWPRFYSKKDREKEMQHLDSYLQYLNHYQEFIINNSSLSISPLSLLMDIQQMPTLGSPIIMPSSDSQTRVIETNYIHEITIETDAYTEALKFSYSTMKDAYQKKLDPILKID